MLNALSCALLWRLRRACGHCQRAHMTDKGSCMRFHAGNLLMGHNVLRCLLGLPPGGMPLAVAALALASAGGGAGGCRNNGSDCGRAVTAAADAARKTLPLPRQTSRSAACSMMARAAGFRGRRPGSSLSLPLAPFRRGCRAHAARAARATREPQLCERRQADRLSLIAVGRSRPRRRRASHTRCASSARRTRLWRRTAPA